MKRFSFQQAQLLRLRQQQVRHAELHLAAATSRVAQAETRVSEQFRALELLGDHFMTDANAMTLVSDISLGMRRRLETLRGHLSIARESQASARQQLTRAMRASDSLLALHDRRLRDHQVKRRKAQQRIIDTYSIHAWMRER